MGENKMNQKQKGLIGLGAMAVLAVAVIAGSGPLYKAIDNMGQAKVSAPAAGYQDGTYTGTAQGFGGEIQAEVTISGGKIDSVKLTGDSETDGIGTNALEQLPDAIVSSQSSDVDAVSGATVSSDGIKEAVNQALSQAQ